MDRALFQTRVDLAREFIALDFFLAARITQRYHRCARPGDDLSDGKDNKIDVSKVDVSMDGIELEDREFIAAIKEKREPNASLAQLLACMRVLGKLEQIVDPQRKAHA